LHLFGPVHGVHAVLDVPRDQGEKFAVATLQFQSGALGVIEANYFGPPWTFDDEIEIVGTNAILRLAGSESLHGGYRGGSALIMFRDGQWSEVAVPDDDWRSSVEASVIAYLDAVTAGREPPVTGADGLETVRLIHRIYDSALILDAGTGLCCVPGFSRTSLPSRPDSGLTFAIERIRQVCLATIFLLG